MIHSTYKHQVLKETEVLVETDELIEKKLIVFNDDYNTFDHVINTLIKVCDHTPEQAEQCTWLIHYKGKCVVKKGEEDQLEQMKNGILDAGIDARILA